MPNTRQPDQKGKNQGDQRTGRGQQQTGHPNPQRDQADRGNKGRDNETQRENR